MVRARRGLPASSRSPRSLASDQGFEAPAERSMARAPPRQARIRRRRVRTSGVNRTKAPFIGSTRALRPERTGHARAFTRARTGPAPLSLAASRSSPVKGLVVASSCPARHDPPFGAPRGHGEDASTRCLQPTHGTSTPRRIRFLAAPALAFGTAIPRTRTHAAGGASLDGEPPASASIAHRLTDRGGRSLEPSRRRGTARSWRVLRSAAPPAVPPGPRRFRPLAGLAT